MTDEPAVPAVPEVLPDKATAVAFTKQLKAKLDRLEEGAADAVADITHTREARLWKAMEYDSWAAYAEAELGMGKRHANRLVRHAIFAGELGPAGSHLSERATRDVPAKRRPAVAKKVRKATEGLPPEEATPKAEAILAKETKRADAAKKRTANFESQEFKVNLVDPARKMLIDLAVAAGMGSDAMATRLLDDLLTTGEVPTLPRSNGARIAAPALESAMARAAVPRQSNVAGDGHKHLATKAKQGASGMVRCDVCGIPKVGTRWVEP